MTTPLLQVEHLKTGFTMEDGFVKAVDGISFTLNRGETLGIVGESGSGKSVAALSLMQLVAAPGKIADGSVLFYSGDKEKVNLLELSEKAMQKYRGNELAMIFQEPMTSLNPVFSCGEQMIETIRLHREKNAAKARAMALSIFEQVKLPDPKRIFESYPHQLSGGQRQRVMIAMAISCQPQILIADEPTTALDVTVQKRILQLMNDLKKDLDGGLIFISHDLGVIAEIADRVLVMKGGKVVEEGTVAQIFSNPKHPYSRGLLACRPPLGKRLKRLPLVSGFLEAQKDANAIPETQAISQKEYQERQEQLKSEKPLLEVKGLSTWFPLKKNVFGKPAAFLKAVDDVNFSVYPGETLGLVGESGCGKTTLGKTLLRLVEPVSGSMIYGGQELTALSNVKFRAFRKKMQIIFQDPFGSLNPRMMIGHALVEPMKVHGIGKNDRERKEIAFDLLETVGLEKRQFNRYPHEFSGGQRQRVGIARALAVKPEFIVCDESVSALDVSVQAQVLNLLIDLRERFNLTYIFISHDLAVVKFMSDRMIVMNKGKIVESGYSEDIYSNPQEEYTRQLIAAIPKGG